jgi:hypothetical protein
MDVSSLAGRLRELMKQEGDLSFRYAELARQAPDDDALRLAGEEAGWFDSREWSTLRMYRLIGLAYAERGWVPDRSWTAHAEAYAHPDRYEILAKFKTKRDIRRATGKKALADDKNAQGEVLVAKLDDFDPSDERVAEAVLRAAAVVEEAQKRAVKTRDEGTGNAPSDWLRATGIVHGVLSALERAGRLVTDEWPEHEKQEYLDSLDDLAHEIEAQKFRLSMTPESIGGNS